MAYAYVSRSAAQGLAPARETLEEMDSAMPLAMRQKGLAIAQAKAKAAPPPGAPKTPAKTASAKAAPANPVPATPAAKKAVVATPAPVAALGKWRIQLGAFSQKASAEALYRKLSGTLSGHQPYYVPAGAVTRLQVGPFESKSSAAAACKAIASSCFPVPAK